MIRFALPVVLALTALPAAAQEGDGELREGLDLFREGSRLILEGLMDDMRPMLEEVEPLFREEFLPFFERLSGLVDDLSAYELPERLPNGDILIRRSPDAPPWGETLPEDDLETGPDAAPDPDPSPDANEPIDL